VVEEEEEELASERRHYCYYFGFYYHFVIVFIVIVSFIEIDENIENIIVESEILEMGFTPCYRLITNMIYLGDDPTFTFKTYEA